MAVLTRIAEKVRFELQRRSPVTEYLLRHPKASGWAKLGLGAARLAAELKKEVPVFVPEQLHQAQLRLSIPDILNITKSGVHIGKGIRIRRIMPQELGEISRPYYEHVRLFEITGPRIEGKPGLHAFIGIHALMPVNGRVWSIGGTRMRGDYESKDHALRDVLRLSRAMTYKCAAAGIPIGGGKCDIWFDPKSPRKDQVLSQFAKALEYLKVIFTGQDMNISVENARLMALIAQHSIIGPSDLSMGGIPPTPPTAKGVFLAIQKAAELHCIPMNKLTVALQGLGGVGANLVPYLLGTGTKVVATDTNPQARGTIVREFGERVTVLADPNSIYDVKAQVFSPSAIEDVLDAATIPRIKAAGVKIVAGAANNPLKNDVADARRLQATGIYYYRDYVVNGGGLMGVASGVMQFDPMERVSSMPASIERLHQLMEKGHTGHTAGEMFAQEKLATWHRLTREGWSG